MNVLASLRVAIGFLTRIPVGDPSLGGTREVHVGYAVPWFPLVGAAIGGIQALVWLGMASNATTLVAATVSIAVATLITGAFHHDGLADMADAFGGGWTTEQRLEILKDSRLGTYGTTALVLAFGLEIAALSSFEVDVGPVGIVSMHVVGRTLALATMLVAPVAADGLGASYMKDIPRAPTSAVIVTAVAAIALISGSMAWALLPAIVAAVAIVILAVRKIEGVNGDVLGAITVTSGVVWLIAASTLGPT